ncbi:MAG: tRNA-dihydrouridine synthase family protein [Muribaculaceae bacterium]|nr:tRNA-dihydrouridine synthase family protein [Muribaculaceae bacterium]
MDEEKVILAGPLQGYTDAAWRQAHAAAMPGAVDAYFAPFARVEHGAVRARDLRDVATAAPTLVPQVIFRSVEEFDLLAGALAAQGHTRIDLNLGCPFPPQVKHGRGAGTLLRPRVLEAVAARMLAMPEVRFSAKMRLGVDDASQWRGALPALTQMPLEYVTIHPRTARQQYSGQLHTAEFAAAADAIPHPVVFNGDIATPADIDRAAALPGVAGVMLGRGLLGRPTLAAEWREGKEWPASRRIEAMLSIHDAVLAARSARLTQPPQLLASMQSFWHFAEPEIGHKAAKALRKAGSMERYREAMRLISAK